MNRLARLASAATSLLVVVLGAPALAGAQAVPGPCVPGVLPSTALSLMCVPTAGWNHQVVVYAPGYRLPQQPKALYQLTTPDGVPLPQLVQSLGYAFATTSYRKTGLVIADGVDDVRQLLAAFRAANPTTTKAHLAGVSEGGLVAALLAEQSPQMFSDALAACGPIGSFRQQVNYLGDFRVLFDYYFPGVLPGSAGSMPEHPDPAVWLGAWLSLYSPAIEAALRSDPAKALELMRVARVAYDPADLTTVIRSATAVLGYNVLGLNDSIRMLGGNPFGNRLRWYSGSSNDLRLNLRVQRFDASPAALAAIGRYETSGDLSIPLVTIHTTADEIAPFAHELLYLPKVDTVGRGAFLPVPVARYGHCNFTAQELALAFLFTANLP